MKIFCHICRGYILEKCFWKLDMFFVFNGMLISVLKNNNNNSKYLKSRLHPAPGMEQELNSSYLRLQNILS